MKKTNLQSKIDKVVYKLFLENIPVGFKPNTLTIIRLILVPLVYLLLFNDYLLSGFLTFLLAASTDLFDGVLARTRNQVTDLGKILDPIADKLLISVVLVYIGFSFIVVRLFLVIILLELIANVFGKHFSRLFNIPIGANIYGKIKMVIQCFCVAAFLVGVLLENETIIIYSEYLLYLALVFAFISGFEQLRRSARHKYQKVKASE